MHLRRTSHSGRPVVPDLGNARRDQQVTLPEYQGMKSIRIDRYRRITIPAGFRRTLPYVLLSTKNEDGEAIRILCGCEQIDFFESQYLPDFRIDAEKNSHRFVLPETTCEDLYIRPGDRLALIGMGAYIEISSLENFSKKQDVAMSFEPRQ